MLFLVVAVSLVVGEFWQGDVVGLDNHVHELVEVLGISVVLGVVQVHGLLDQELGRPADDRDIRVALEGDVILGSDLGRGDPGPALLELGGGVADLLRSLADGVRYERRNDKNVIRLSRTVASTRTP